MPCSRFLYLFFFNDTATTEIYTLSLHDALPIFTSPPLTKLGASLTGLIVMVKNAGALVSPPAATAPQKAPSPLSCAVTVTRSEEHTSELQSRLHLVCRLLLEKKKTAIPTQSQTS